MVLIQACKDCGEEKPTLVSCVEILNGNQHPCHHCRKCVLEIPLLKDRIIYEGICSEHEVKRKLGGYRLVS